MGSVRWYYALLNVITSCDGWLLIVKGWSVTLSLAVDEDTGEPLPVRPPWRSRVLRGDNKPRKPEDWRADEPERRKPQDIYKRLRHRFLWPNVALPHLVAVGLGSGANGVSGGSVSTFRRPGTGRRR